MSVGRAVSIVEALVLVEVKYHQHFRQSKSLGVQLYPTGFVPATLPLDHPGLARSRRPRPVPVGSGLAGGVLAVRVADLVVADGADGTDLLAPVGAGPVARRGSGGVVHGGRGHPGACSMRTAG